MATLSEQLYISLGLPMDARLSNLVLEGANILVESAEDYLLRIDLNSRYLNMPISFFFPSGIYSANDFVILVNNNTIKASNYSFKNGLEDVDLGNITLQAIDNVDNVGVSYSQAEVQSIVDQLNTTLQTLRDLGLINN